jgi:hypothetical protein
MGLFPKEDVPDSDYLMARAAAEANVAVQSRRDVAEIH